MPLNLVCRFCLAIACVFLTACGPSTQVAVSESQPVRAISLDYCADQFVLKLLPKAQIVALSPDAEKYFSYLRASAKGIRKVRPMAENVLALQPTVVVRSYGGGPNALEFFNRAGVQVVQLGYPNDLDAVKQSLLQTATELHVAERGVAVVKELEQRLAHVAKLQALSSEKIATLYTTPGGVTTGPGSLVHELMIAAGLSNFEQQAGWRSLSLERLVTEQPQMIAAAQFGDPASHVDAWTVMRHPLMNKMTGHLPRVPLQGAWTSCGGWFLVDAIEALAASARTVNAAR